MDEQKILDIVMEWVNIPYILAFIFIAYLLIVQLKKFGLKMNSKYFALLLALVLAIPFYYLSEEGVNKTIMKLIISYAIATSFYELFIKFIIDKIHKK